MARGRQLGDLIEDVRDRADIENSLHITDAQITRYINQSGAALHAMMVECNEDEFIEVFSGTTAAPSSNQTNISLGAVAEETTGAYKLIAVEVVLSGERRRLNRWTWQDHGMLLDLTASASGPHLYRWISYTVQIIPGVPTGTSYYIYAVPPFVDLSDPADEIDGRDGWEEWVVLDAAIKCMTKEESDIRPLVAEREAVETRLRQQIMARDLGRPHRVQDVTGWLVNDEEIRAGRMAPS